MKQRTETAKKMGRPIGFDKEAALDAAMRAFWERGYEGTSIAYLVEVMGLNPPSIYAAFGDKMSLFQAAARRYVEGPGQYRARALREPTLKGVVQALFRNTVEFLNDATHPAGCLMLTAAASCSVEDQAAKDFLAEIRKHNEAGLRSRLREARNSGELPVDVNLDDYARYISTLISGLAVQATNGVSRAEMKRVADMAVRHLGY